MIHCLLAEGMRYAASGGILHGVGSALFRFR